MVHRARQPSIGRDVAITVVPASLADDPDFVRGFESRAQAVASVEHPGIVPVYDYWREPGGAYLVMRHYPTGTLARRLAAGPMAPDDAWAAAKRVIAALWAARSARRGARQPRLERCLDRRTRRCRARRVLDDHSRRNPPGRHRRPHRPGRLDDADRHGCSIEPCRSEAVAPRRTPAVPRRGIGGHDPRPAPRGRERVGLGQRRRRRATVTGRASTHRRPEPVQGVSGILRGRHRRLLRPIGDRRRTRRRAAPSRRGRARRSVRVRQVVGDARRAPASRSGGGCVCDHDGAGHAPARRTRDRGSPALPQRHWWVSPAS